MRAFPFATNRRMFTGLLALSVSLGGVVAADIPASATPTVVISALATDWQADNLWHVYVGSCNTKAGANKTANRAKAKGFSAYVKDVDADGCYIAQLGAFKSKVKASALVKKAKAAGLTSAQMAYFG